MTDDSNAQPSSSKETEDVENKGKQDDITSPNDGAGPSTDTSGAIRPSMKEDQDENNMRLSSGVRWSEAVNHARAKVGQQGAEQGRNDARARWKRAIFLATQLSYGRGVVTSENKYDTQAPEAKMAKILETQHWLELIDSKHRYGSNLKYYHQKWIAEDTKENFFMWLDKGGGKTLDLPECPREQLEKERIIFLSAEQRLNYLVEIDSEGKLRWARNHEYVDTTPNRWKDAGDGKGIVPTDGNEDDKYDTTLHRRRSFDESSLSSSDLEEEQAKHYAGDPEPDVGPIRRLWRNNFTMKGMTDRILRKTVQKNTWIYVCDLDYHMYIGIKQTGTFQHSSFFGGSVSSAGLLTVKQGLVTSLSPLSGHYRASISYFDEFIKVMDEKGLDLHKVHVTKGEAMLWGLEHYGKFQKSKHRFVKSNKEKMKSLLNRFNPSHKKRKKKLKRRGLSGRERAATAAEGPSKQGSRPLSAKSKDTSRSQSKADVKQSADNDRSDTSNLPDKNAQNRILDPENEEQPEKHSLVESPTQEVKKELSS
ncbi:hypothetical protein FRC02_006442 [Tulasnella sp. 418]|nr:hypothetical protein FRC02_006442 [Tulasnella sp. 418]